ncbi:hypothetical protein BRC91_01155 [Halobacteriales archaeon QS_4_62_28]|nr:MAG: hypothetical protein BRC91_01155 [Halobacteriales archaeon QS_4_62_28]
MLSMTSEVPDGSTAQSPPATTEDIVQAVAEKKGVNETDLMPLYYVLDPEGLDSIVTHTDTTVKLTFDYEGYTVTVEDETVTLEEN